MSPKQTSIIKYLREHGTITVAEAVPLIGRNIYANQSFHVGNVLRNMVKRGMLIRVDRGKYMLPMPKSLEALKW